MTTETRLVEVRRNVLKQNDILARDLRRRFEEASLFVASLVSSPGTGKTEFLEKTLSSLRRDYRVAALVGDLATANDAERLERSGAPVRQITTGTICHLEAQMVENALEGWDLNELDCLFIENVGNLVCPSSYDLGERLRVVLMSVTEGEDKPLKYPTIFNTADVAVITKMDLAEAVEFDLEKARASIQAVRPGMRIIEVSAKTGAGMDDWMEFLEPQIDLGFGISDLGLEEIAGAAAIQPPRPAATPPGQEGSLKRTTRVSRSGCHPSFSKEGSLTRF